MHSGQTVVLSEPVSQQRTGIVLHWQMYMNNQVYENDHNYFFIPKSHAETHNGSGVAMVLTNAGMDYISAKYVYVYDDRLVGYVDNSSAARKTNAGVTATANYFVLTEVLGI